MLLRAYESEEIKGIRYSARFVYDARARSFFNHFSVINLSMMCKRKEHGTFVFISITSFMMDGRKTFLWILCKKPHYGDCLIYNLLSQI